jgi:hypothetical protein
MSYKARTFVVTVLGVGSLNLVPAPLPAALPLLLGGLGLGGAVRRRSLQAAAV